MHSGRIALQGTSQRRSRDHTLQPVHDIQTRRRRAPTIDRLLRGVRQLRRRRGQDFPDDMTCDARGAISSATELQTCVRLIALGFSVAGMMKQQPARL